MKYIYLCLQDYLNKREIPNEIKNKRNSEF